VRPFAALTAIIFGSATAISFGLTATAAVFGILSGEEPQLREELPALIKNCVIFVMLAAVAGACLYGTLKLQRWRMWAQTAMWIGLTLTIFYYWPK
jgi:hypothetical protein